MVYKDNLAILDEFKFEIQPVGIKYLTQKPDDIKLIDERITLCAMLRKAQGRAWLGYLQRGAE